MARMVPTNGPRGGRACDPAERRLYDRIARELPDDWMVIHGASWVGSGSPAPDGACSFLVADPDRGLLLLDLYPAGLTYDPHGDRWRTPRRSGTQSGGPIEDPIDRLERHSVGLAAMLGRQPAAPLSRPLVGWAVVLPTAHIGSHGLAPQAPGARIIDRQGLDRLPARLNELFAHWQERRPAAGNASPRWWWRALEELFVAPRQARVRLRDRIEADRAEILSLSAQQTLVLEMLARVRRLTVYGPAGTGKTVLALTKARLLAARGQQVLLTCYNKALGHFLRDQTDDEPLITAVHFHELCWELGGLEAAGVKPPDGRERQYFFDYRLPKELTTYAERHGPSFDAVVVDEAQDFLPHWWSALDTICWDGERAIRYLFYDDGQCLRDHHPNVPGADEALVLRTNWRNTQAIHAWLGRAEPRLRETLCAAPEGVPVEVERLRTSSAAASASTGDSSSAHGEVLRRLLHRLVDGDGLRPEDIVILTGRSPRKSKVAQLPQPVGPVVISVEGGPGVVRLSSVQAFKGLEAPVVILTELDGYPAARASALFYVGASRAMNHLIVLDDALPPHEPRP